MAITNRKREKNIKYQVYTAGRAGNGRINLATGKLEFTHQDINSNSNVARFIISHIYGEVIGKNVKKYGGGSIATYGKNFSLVVDIGDMDTKFLTFSESNGKITSIVFENTNPDTDVRTHIKFGYIFEYVNNKLDCVKETNFENRTTKFNYNGDLLYSITYPNGDISKFVYDSNGALEQMISPNGAGIKLHYLNSKVQVVSDLPNNSHEEVEDPIKITYEERKTAVESLQGKTGSSILTGLKVQYTFDLDGEAISEYYSGGVESKLILYDVGNETYEFIQSWSDVSESQINEITAKFNVKPADGIRLCDWQLDGVWVYTSFNGDNKTGELYSRQNIEDTFEGQISTTKRSKQIRKQYTYFPDGKLQKEEIFERQTYGFTVEDEMKKSWTEYSYEFDDKGNLKATVIKDSSELVQKITSEFFPKPPTYIPYCTIAKITTYKIDPNKSFDQRQYIEKGNVSQIFSQRWNSPTNFLYINNTNILKQVITPKSSTSISPSTTQTTNFEYQAGSDMLKSISAVVDNIDNKTEFGYTSGLLTEIKSAAKFNYEYDNLGRRNKIKIDNRDYVNYNYENPNVVLSTYGNGDIYSTNLDKMGRVTSVKRTVNGIVEEVLTNTYEGKNLISSTDREETTTMKYTTDGRMYQSKSNDITMTSDVNTNGQISKVKYIIDGKVYQTFNYEYDEMGRPYRVNYTPLTGSENEYDEFGRKTKLGGLFPTTFTYKIHGYSGTSNLIQNSVQNGGSVYSRVIYDYDSRDNLTMEKFDFIGSNYYSYDSLNRLVSEAYTFTNNSTRDRYSTYTYDSNGNILNKSEYSGTDELLKDSVYTYDGDKIISIGDEPCGDYDQLGNPRVYRNFVAKWDLKSLISYKDTNFEYRAGGGRRAKIANNCRTKFYYAGGQLLAEKRIKMGNNNFVTANGNYAGDEIVVDSSNNIVAPCEQPVFIQYNYDCTGICGFTVNNKQYNYRKNLRGDVLEIYDNNNMLYAEYSYNAWGVHTVTNYNDGNIGDINPIRYKGYYFDTETGFYWINNRYYDPETGRFISAACPTTLDETSGVINGTNLYIAHRNNPTMFPPDAVQVPAIDLLGDTKDTNGFKNIFNVLPDIGNELDMINELIKRTDNLIGGIDAYNSSKLPTWLMKGLPWVVAGFDAFTKIYDNISDPNTSILDKVGNTAFDVSNIIMKTYVSSNIVTIFTNAGAMLGPIGAVFGFLAGVILLEQDWFLALFGLN